VLARGIARRRIFIDDTDRSVAVEAIQEAVESFGIRVLSYVLMPNHYHLVVIPSEGDLPRAMHMINTRLAGRHGVRDGTPGHVFESRYQSLRIEHDRHLRVLVVYHAMNPVTAGLCRRPADYAWSSCRHQLAPELAPAWLDTAAVIERFASEDALRTAVLAGTLPPCDEHGRPRLDWLVAQGDDGIWVARMVFGYGLRAIARAAGTTHDTISRRLLTIPEPGELGGCV
jgi:REP element-mobilizing transposase RayT